MFLLNKSKHKVSSRKQIQIKEVRDGILVLPQNQYRLIIETSSINFELKSEEEQDVLIDSFQNFLNALPCPLQILVRVREVDIDAYLEYVRKSKLQEKEKVYKNQIDTYCEFIENLVSGNKILSRRFYIILSYCHTDKKQDFTIIKEQMRLTRDIILKGFERFGMRARHLDSLEVLELFYAFYNPQQAKTQELKGHTINMLLQNQYA